MALRFTQCSASSDNEWFYRTSIGGDSSGGNSRNHADCGMRRAVGYQCHTRASCDGRGFCYCRDSISGWRRAGRVAITPSGGNLYTANLLDGTISAFTVQSNGSLAPVNGSPFQTGLHPVALCVTSNGRFLYVASSGGQNVSGFAISAGGTLTQAGTPSPAGFSPLSVSADATGNLLYVTSGVDNSLSAFRIDQSTGC